MKVKSNLADVNNLDYAYEEYLEDPREESLADLLMASTALIKHFSICYNGGRYNVDTLQAGYEGVLKALKKYDIKYNTTFTTYATHCIAGEIRHYIRKEMRYYKMLSFADATETEGLPSINCFDKEIAFKKKGVNEIICKGFVSYEQYEFDLYESFMLPVEERIILSEALGKLSVLKRSVIYYLFFQSYTQQQTADLLGLNQRKVSRLLKSSLLELKGYLVE